MKLALYGGTFDPFHGAHLAVAREARDRCGMERVLVVPAANPPHKPEARTAAYHHRLRMIELACDGEAMVEASRLEENTLRSYSIDTITQVRGELSDGDELFFVIGADAFAEITTWYRWQDVVAAVTFLVVTRPGHAYAVPQGARVEPLATLALPISSSDLRRRLSHGERPAELHPAVLDYVAEHGLYGFPRVVTAPTHDMPTLGA